MLVTVFECWVTVCVSVGLRCMSIGLLVYVLGYWSGVGGGGGRAKDYFLSIHFVIEIFFFFSFFSLYVLQSGYSRFSQRNHL